MKRARFHWCLIILGVFAVAGFGQAQRRMQLDDLGRIVRVSDPQIAPDGKSIVIVVSRANHLGLVPRSLLRLYAAAL